MKNLLDLTSAFRASGRLGADFLPDVELMVALGAFIFVGGHAKLLWSGAALGKAL